MNTLILDSEIENLLSLIDIKIKNNLKSGNNYLKGSIDYLLLSRGKMLRPTLLLIGSMFGTKQKKDNETITDIASAIETLHLATLIHDDVIDEAKLRRGLESIQSKYSKEYAIYMGDYLLSRCFLLLTEINIEKQLAVNIAKAVSKICTGEIKQYQNRYNYNISFMEYLRIVSGKTAALISMALGAGAYISNAKKSDIKRLAHIGYKIGIAFQLIDDILDYAGDNKTVGKELQTDILRGYYGLPLIHSLRSDSPYREKIIKRLESGVTNSNIKEVLQLINKSGSIEYTLELARKYHNKAVDLTNKLPESKGKELLLELIYKLTKRVF